MAAPAHARPRLRRTWPQRLLIAFNCLVIVGCLTGAGGLGYFYVQFNRLPRVTLAPHTLAEIQPPGDPENFLLVGSDSRAFVDSPDDAKSFGGTNSTGGARSDTIMLVRVDPKAHHAWMLSFPRDLWLPIAPDGHLQRINTAFDTGPQNLIDTIKSDFNVPIHHYAQVDFKGFQGLVNTVGGVVLYVPSPIRDTVTGLNITDTGCVLFHGDQALAYVRSRHFQYQENGHWKSDPTGDLGRITRQQDFIRRAMREALSKDLFNPARINRLVNVGLDNVKVDDALDLKELLRLGKTFKTLDANAITQYSLPTVNAVTSGGASVLKIQPQDEATVNTILDVFRGVPQPEAPTEQQLLPSGVTLRVLNGSGVTNQATDVTSALRQAGFSVQAPGQDTHTTRTVIRYAEGQQAKAELLERYLVNGAEIQQYPGLTGVDAVLVTGGDFAGVLATPRPAPPSSTTTTAPAAVATSGPDAPQC